MQLARNEVRVNQPFTIKAWVNDEGMIGALLVESHSTTTAQFRDQQGVLRQHIAGDDNPVDVVNEKFHGAPPDIEVTFTRSGVQVTIPQEGANAATAGGPSDGATRVKDLFQKTMLTMFAVKKRVPSGFVTDVVDGLDTKIVHLATRR
jgi:hypothetical protein